MYHTTSLSYSQVLIFLILFYYATVLQHAQYAYSFYCVVKTPFQRGGRRARFIFFFIKKKNYG